MWLITGGAYQGKLDYALKKTKMKIEDTIDGASCSMGELIRKPLVNHFHLWIKRMLEEKQDIRVLVEQIKEENPNLVIITNELGCGIVPVDPFDREYREETGRVCQILANEAKEVHRVVCGIGMVIKDD